MTSQAQEEEKFTRLALELNRHLHNNDGNNFVLSLAAIIEARQMLIDEVHLQKLLAAIKAVHQAQDAGVD